MNRAELVEFLEREGVAPRSYSLSGGTPDERYCLDESYGRYTVYYAERGIRRNERTFESEEDACRHLLDLLIRDPTTRVRE